MTHRRTDRGGIPFGDTRTINGKTLQLIDWYSSEYNEKKHERNLSWLTDTRDEHRSEGWTNLRILKTKNGAIALYGNPPQKQKQP